MKKVYKYFIDLCIQYTVYIFLNVIIINLKYSAMVLKCIYMYFRKNNK